MLAVTTVSAVISVQFMLTALSLWVMGCSYNVPPVRSKDLPYVDVLSEAINNPIRMLAGWFIVTDLTIAPASLLLSYWMIGCYFMGLKRFAEYRNIGDAARASAYRKSFRYFTSESLLVSIMFYGSAAMLFFGAFCMRYRLELILAFPAIALVMALYLHVAMKDNSAAQNPERLYREHIAIEDHDVFPAAARVLSAADVEAVGREMAVRRGLAHGPPQPASHGSGSVRREP